MLSRWIPPEFGTVRQQLQRLVSEAGSLWADAMQMLRRFRDETGRCGLCGGMDDPLAQQAGKAYPIGLLDNSTEALEANLVGPFREGLCEHGYVQGRDLTIECRWAEGAYERLPVLIAELIALQSTSAVGFKPVFA